MRRRFARFGERTRLAAATTLHFSPFSSFDRPLLFFVGSVKEDDQPTIEVEATENPSSASQQPGDSPTHLTS
jgi:hypothetical protein